MKLMTLNATSTTSSITVSDALFGAPVNKVLMAQAVRVYLARLRQGTAKTKTRAEINRTHKKWFKQKGTGNARHGARTPNIFVGGGVSHGPNGKQNWMLDMNQTMKHGALISAFSAQAAQVAVADIPTNGKTARKLLQGEQKTLVILAEADQEIIRGIRNMATILVTTADRVTALEVLSADRIILNQAAIDRLEARLVTSEKVAPAAVEPAVKPAKTTATKAKAAVKVAKAPKATTVKAPKVAKPATKKVAKKA